MLFIVWIDNQAFDADENTEVSDEQMKAMIEEALDNFGLEGKYSVDIKHKED